MDLAGCVNDARDWQALLEARGYHVDPLHDGEATRARIVEALTSIIGSAADGDSVVFAFAGHGSWLPDTNGDEPDARDEMMCPVDVMQGAVSARRRLEQDLQHQARGRQAVRDRGLLSLRIGFAGRAAAGRAGRHALEGAISSPVRVYAWQSPIRARDRPRSRTRLRRRKNAYPALLFSGCRDSEFSYDASFSRRPNGVFTRTAIDVLQDAGITSPRALHDAVRKQLPSQSYPQTPQLFGSKEAQLGPLF